ncbi:MAG: hypothetical protein KDA24_04330 [Deltaproteobacteria bacterium]|nr:hypothetical protein [Deltaproteobacteria bacterium]
MAPLPHGLLLLPRPGENTTGSLRRKVRLLAIRDLLGLGTPWSAALEATLRTASAQTLASVGAPDVLPSLLAARSGLVSLPEALSRAVPNLLCSLHAAGVRPPEPILYEGPVAHLAGLGARSVHLERPGRAVLLDAAGLSVELADGAHVDVEQLPSLPSSHPLPGTGVALCLDDTNPLSHLEDHPDKAGNAVDLGGHSLDEWTRELGKAFDVIKSGLPHWFDELPQSLCRLLPVGYEPERHLSASYGDAPGIAYLTLHPSGLTLAEAVVHETQHGKLNLLLWLDEVLENGRTDWATSPVRPDLRPLMGVLLAVHAFIPVAALHARLLAAGHPLAAGPSFERRRTEVLSGNEGGLAVLRTKARPTRVGARLLEALEALHAATLTGVPALPEATRALPPG